MSVNMADNDVESEGTPILPYSENDPPPSYHEIDPSERPIQAKIPTRVLTNCQRFSYGVGHVQNDLAASMWFSYLLVFLHQVRNFPNLLAGNLMLIGQVSDAIFTPFIGFESDKSDGIKWIGKRKTWHVVGTLCVMCSFPFLFTECITCGNSPNIAQFIYYAPFVVIFQFGWASTQISHLSLANDCTPHPSERTLLQSVRNSFSVIANLAVYGIFVLLFELSGDSGTDSGDLGPADESKFRNLAIICIGLGFIFNIVFYSGTKEKRAEPRPEESLSGPEGEYSIERSAMLKSKMIWKDWLKEHQFYQIALIFMSTRLYINVSQVYFPMYLTETIKLDKKAIAILPLVTYISSFCMSLAAPLFNKYLGRKPTFLFGILIGAGSCVSMYFVGHHSNYVYGSAVLMGAAGSLLLITAIAMVSDLIGDDAESGAFVFGAMSFTDKLSNGLAILLIQKFHPCVGCCPACEPYYREVQSFVPGGALVMAMIALVLVWPQMVGSRRKHAKLTLMVRPDALPPVGHARPRLSGTNATPTFTTCACGHFFYVPIVTCPSCGMIPAGPATSQCLSDEQDRYQDEDSDSCDERKPLKRNINTPDINVTRRYT